MDCTQTVSKTNEAPVKKPTRQFRFKFRQCFSEKVEKLFYKVDTHGADVPHHTLQMKSSERLICLLCIQPITLPTSRLVLEAHFAGHTNVSEDAFDAYQKYFLSSCETEQMQQMYFNPKDSHTVHCLVCEVMIPYNVLAKHNALPEHCEKVSHLKNSSIYWPQESQVAALTEQATENWEKMLTQKCNKVQYCLLCRKTITTVRAHLMAKTHKQILAQPNQKAMKLVKEFHHIWQMELADFVEFKKFFVTKNNKAFACLICNQNVTISHVKNHLLHFPCSFLSKLSPIYDKKYDWDKYRNTYVNANVPVVNFTAEILMNFYEPKELFDKARTIDGLKIYTIQRRYFAQRLEIFCLLCKIIICESKENLIDQDKIFEHLETKDHKERSYNTRSIDLLYDYHKFFGKANHAVQMMQGKINPYKVKQGKCAACKLKGDYKAVIAHIKKGCLFSDKSEPVNDSQHELPVNANSEQQSGSSVKTDDKSVSDSNGDDDDDEDNLSYDEQTILKLYSMCNTPKGCRRPPVLTIQKRNEHEKFCLACLMTVQISAMDHINSLKHEAIVKENFAVLTSYHRFWMLQSPEKQLQQIYFNPVTLNQLHCIVCKKLLIVTDVWKHKNCINRMQKKYTNSVFPENYRELKLTYDPITMKRLFYGVHYDITRDFFQTNIPVSYMVRNHIYCMLCNNPKDAQLYRDPNLLKRHFSRFHSKPSEERLTSIMHLVEFHEFWAAQKPEHQIYLANYFIISRTSLVCSRAHMVPLHKGVEHIENPGECPLHEVVKTQMNNRNNQREGLAQKMDNLKISDADKQEKQPKEHIVEPLLPNANASATIENGINKVIELPTHLKLHQEYLKYVPNIKMVQCVACKIEISNDLFTLRNHVTHPSHLKQINQENYGKKINYYCEICPQTLNNEKQWILHLDAPNHKQKTKRLGNSRQDNLKENICLACNTIIFGDAISAMRHKLDGVSQLRKDKVGQLTVGIKELLNSRRKIEEKSKALGKECQKFEEQTKPLIQKCISDLEQILKDVYPDCKIYQFGSRVVGVINEESDLDLFIDIGGRYAASDESGDSRVQQKLVSATCKLLRTHSKVFKDLLSIPSARVPIIKALHCSTEIDCDLSFANGLSVENTRLIKFYVNYEPAFYGALLILKEWGQQMKPKLKNDLTSYALCIMLIFKMQVDGYLPSVHQVREMSTFDVVNIAGWDTIDYTKLDSEQLRTFTHKAESVSEVVLSFFRYYGDNFNYSTDVACPLLGKTFKVKDFDAKGEKLPAEMHTYKRKIAVDPDAQFRCLCHMFVQDPFDLGHNLTKNINKSFVNSFKKVCRMSYEHVRK